MFLSIACVVRFFVFSYKNESICTTTLYGNRIMAIAPLSNAALTNGAPSAEILESSTTGWLAQCRTLHEAPAFGSFVRAPEDERRAIIYGVVSHIETVPFDASRRPSALWTREDDMDARHPQIGKLLRTTFSSRCIGWSEKYQSGSEVSNSAIIHAVPPQPPRLHSFCNPCTSDEVRRFTAKTDWLRLLTEGAGGYDIKGASVDELLVACCREAIAAHDNDRAYAVRLGQALALPLRADYHRLRALLSRLLV